MHAVPSLVAQPGPTNQPTAIETPDVMQPHHHEALFADGWAKAHHPSTHPQFVLGFASPSLAVLLFDPADEASTTRVFFYFRPQLPRVHNAAQCSIAVQDIAPSTLKTPRQSTRRDRPCFLRVSLARTVLYCTVVLPGCASLVQLPQPQQPRPSLSL